jgi:hypothetical protein
MHYITRTKCVCIRFVKKRFNMTRKIASNIILEILLCMIHLDHLSTHTRSFIIRALIHCFSSFPTFIPTTHCFVGFDFLSDGGILLRKSHSVNLATVWPSPWGPVTLCSLEYFTNKPCTKSTLNFKWSTFLSIFCL